jgi:hypothetical protein
MYRSHAGVYGPSKPSSLSSIDAWLKPTASLAESHGPLSRAERWSWKYFFREQ